MLAMCGMAAAVHAQDATYTLSNGRLWWYEGADGIGHTTPVAFDKNSVPKAWAKVWRYNPSNVTHITVMGNVFLRLDLTDPVHPAIQSVETADFDPYCVWYRTSESGYYYQTWTISEETYRFYLVGSPSELKVVRYNVKDPIENTTYWYNWDFGAALSDVSYVDGNRKTAYHWIMYDDKNAEGTLGTWTMSHDSYQRPEDVIYDRKCGVVDGNGDPVMDPEHPSQQLKQPCPIRASGNPSVDSVLDEEFKTYYDPYTRINPDNSVQIIPNGNGALYMPVAVEGHDKEISSIPADKGLVSIGVAYNETSASSLRYGQTATVSPNIVVTNGGGLPYQAQVTDPYTEYRLEVKRRGLHLDYGQRETETFGSAGIPEYVSYYYYGSPVTRHLEPPTSYADALVVEKVNYKLSNSSRRHLTLSATEVMSDAPVTVNCVEVPHAGAVASVTVTVTYTNGTTQSKDVEILLNNHVDRSPMPNATNAPVVRGYVVGGGRMANVGGNTSITVHACDSIYALYGGNDIAGWVQGDNGATLNLGTTKTNADHKVHIGYVYGGGCGYYTYRGINFGVDENDVPDIYPYDFGPTDFEKVNTSLIYQSYYFNGEVYPWHYQPKGEKWNESTQSWEPYTPASYPTILPEDTTGLHWNWERDEGGADQRIVTTQFYYNPVHSNPADVDASETGNDGTGTVPYIKRATIEVGVRNHPGNDYILIDTLFGGAENAFIGVQASVAATTIDVFGGTIYAVFGGNNYGGSVAETAKNVITIAGTKIAPKAGDANFSDFQTAFMAATGHEYTGHNLYNTYFRGYGRDYGIRYVYGGGNLVESSESNVYITGGMVDTCFLGGNRASVKWPIGVIYCTGSNFIYENDSITREWVDGSGNLISGPEPWKVAGAHLSDHINWGDAANFATNYASLANHSPGRFNLDIGRYNVRAFFGGNNNAPMYDISRINLWSGGVGVVYGGGNAGDMRSSRPVSDVPDMASRIGYAMNGWAYQWPEVFSCFVHSPGPNITMEDNLAPPDGQSSRIICEQVYGGCRMANVRYSTGVWLSGGVFGYVHGGNDISGDVGTETGEGTYVVLDGSSVVLQDVYGGSDGFYHCHERKTNPKPTELGERYMEGGDVPVDYNDEPYDPYDEYVGMLTPTQNSSNLYIHANVDGHQPRVLFSAYGGGVMTNIGYNEAGNKNRILIRDSASFTGTGVNGLTYTNGERNLLLPGGEKGNKLGSVHFQFNGGTVGSELHHGDGYGDGNAYGGGYLSSIFGLSYTYIHGTSTIKGSLYAGNDCMGSIEYFGAYKIDPVVFNGVTIHPGVSPADFVASDGTHMNIEDGTDDLGNPKYSATHSALVRLEGTPYINCVYGSGNGAYDYDGSRPEYSSLEVVCMDEATDNRPLQSSSFIDINTSGGMIDTVFGGGNGVGVRDNVRVLLNNTDANVYAVGTIFGGNNRDNIATCVPDIILKSGTVDYVFGGGNSGNMNAKKKVTSYCGEEVDSVSCYVRVDNENVTVNQAIFGGCRKADVMFKAYVDIRNSNTADGKGVNYVYGGNDISGTVHGNTRIDVSGGRVAHIYGGSNGHYEYDQILDGWNVYTFGQPHNDANLIAEGTSGVPFVDKTTINLWGGQIDDNVYGGGRLGDCRLTFVDVDDRKCPSVVDDPETPGDETEYHDLIINGAVYGGGEGIWEDLNKPHRGNVVSTDDGDGYTTVHLHHASNLTAARAYGGGRGGDVENTYIEAYDTWEEPFSALYGGCWGSTVFGTTHVVMRGVTGDENTTAMTADSVFGGNDFTGYVNATDVRIISGRYGNVYGAGNGNYVDSKYTSGVYAGNFPDPDGEGPLTAEPKRLYVPNTFKVNINMEGGVVKNNIYGGGKMGTSIPYKLNDIGALYKDANGRYVADTLRTNITTARDYDPNNLPFDDPTKYSHLIVNIKGGRIENNVYGGAAGTSGGQSLVYGLKMVNMSGGYANDIYGGSENVSDGYWHECYHLDPTDPGETVTRANYQSMSTKRPSSIINVTGGTVNVNIYGGGYLGNVFGSAYVNVGIDAVDSCEVWRNPDGTATVYEVFRPGATDGLVEAMPTGTLNIENSIYGGANWGENAGSSSYDADGFFGGNNWIIVDGNQYNTYMDEEHVTLPTMNIVYSVIGSGTSAKGGDLKSRIDIRNYGAPNSGIMNTDNCAPNKQIQSIQRASELWLHNTAIDYLGEKDAISAYQSREFTINHIGTMNTMGYNIISLRKTATNISHVNFYKEGWPLVLTDNNAFDRCFSTSDPACPACAPEGSVCQQLTMLNRSVNERRLPAILMHQGINVDFMDENDQYSNIEGFAYIMAEQNTNAVITAAPKYGDVNVYDGGFMPACSDSLKVIDNVAGSQGEVLSWEYYDPTNVNHNNPEYSYLNYSTQYRVWSIGEGTRTRFAVVQAHSVPEQLEVNKPFTKIINGVPYNFTMSKSTLKLPPTEAGHYYKINGPAGVVISDENEEMRMTDQACLPSSWDNMDNTWHPDDDPDNNATEHSEEPNIRLVGDNPSRLVQMVLENPGTYFGLVMTPGSNFKIDPVTNKLVAPSSVGDLSDWDTCTAVSGNEHVNTWSNFVTAQVSDNTNALPEMNLFVTYGNEISHTLVGYINFTLDEYVAVPKRMNYNGDGQNAPNSAGQYNTGEIDPNGDGNGHIKYLDSNLNMPIQVQITISTIMEDFSDMEYEVLAMYNEGRSNIFSRKVVIPATLEGRELYLTKVEWAPTTKYDDAANGYVPGNGHWTHSSENPTWFNLTSDSASIQGQGNLFRMTIKPSDNITNSIASSTGWHTRDVREPLDLATAVGKGDGQPHQISDGTNHYTHNALTVPGDYGKLIGTLDGHGEAALDVNLNYDGDYVYDKVPGKGYVGKVVMTFKSYKGSAASGEPRKEFKLTINVKTRDIGDTIYVASAPSITRNNRTLTGHDLRWYSENEFFTDVELKTNAGKFPDHYLTNIKDAFDERIYQEGDVICILDTLNITSAEPLLIKGSDYMYVPVIRYDGHHNQMPGEKGVYRGTMIKVAEPGASFTARFITFNGGMLSKIEPDKVYTERGYDGAPSYTWDDHEVVYNPIPGALDNAVGRQKYADTNIVFGPVIAVSNGGTVSLQNGVNLEYNYNGYKGDDMTRYGAINVGTNGVLNLINNVTIQHNLSDTILNGDYLHTDADNTPWRIHPYNGAVFVSGGKLELLASNANTAVNITKNYVGDSNASNHTNRFWEDYTKDVSGVQKLLRYDFVEHSGTLANVLLMRQPNTTLPLAQQDTADSQSELIYFSSTISPSTRIGVSKWFPDIDEELRDTIQIVYQASGSHLSDVVANDNFSSDGGYFVMFNNGVNPQRVYLQRCATFRHQVLDDQNEYFAGSGIYPLDVLEYKGLPNVNCPAAGDTIVYRVQGGFFPYTFNWSGHNTLDHTTRYTSNEIKKQVKSGNYNGFKASIADTLITYNMMLGTMDTKTNLSFTVQATDASGNCHLNKVIDLTLAKETDPNAPQFDATKYNGAATTVENAFSDTNHINHARATRNYHAVRITPKVWASPYNGVIQSVVYNADHSDYSVFIDDGMGGGASLSEVLFCEGEVIKLATTPKFAGEPATAVAKFVMWDFDPYYAPTATFVVPTVNRDVVAYYSPLDYWKDVVNTTTKAGVAYDENYTYSSRPTVTPYSVLGENVNKAGYVTTYNGDVHIYNENGLAWFISTVNGLNGTQAREFYFNKVFLHQKDGGYDMKDHLWSPVGNRQHAFRGWFQGVAGGAGHEADTARLTDGEQVVIKNIVLDEPEMNNVGFFGFLDTARVYSINLNGALVRGNEYVGALAANSRYSRVNNCVVEGGDVTIDDDGDVVYPNSTTILTTHYVSGGMMGESDHDIINGSTVSAKYVGDAVYSGGVIGYGNSSVIANSGVRNDSRMSGLYVGGLAGYLNGNAPVKGGIFRKAKSGDLSVVTNNYVNFVNNGRSEFVGGIVGRSANTTIANNYVYGNVAGTSSDGAVGAILNNGTQASNNYYENGSAKRVSGTTASSATVATTASFEGNGNHVTTDQLVYGVDNLTRVLNFWVRENGANTYKTWRSDLEGKNHGYPIFGQPDLIPVETRLTLENCEAVEWEGSVYTTDTMFNINIIDSVLMVDSTTALTIIVHHGSKTVYEDTIDAGAGYSGYGFYLTPTETSLMYRTLDSAGSVTMVLSDTLTTSFGCDSIITLALTINYELGIADVAPVNEVKVYPNPTTSYVTVEAEQLKHVELYDNEGRRLADYVDAAGNSLTINLERLASGIYYLRVHTADKVTIQKIIKK